MDWLSSSLPPWWAEQVTQAFASLRVGDKLQLQDGAKYELAGRMTLRTPDGTVWNEWLLSPLGVAPAAAIANRVHRWLVGEPKAGVTLWAPEQVPPGFGPGSLSGSSIDYGERKYLVRERDTMQVEAIAGDVGGDASVKEKFEFVDLASGLSLMTVEWNDRGLEINIGRRIAGHDLINWARYAGSDLKPRLPSEHRSAGYVPSKGYSSAPPSKDAELGIVGWILVLVTVAILISLDECSGPDQDCRQQLNPTTQRMETVCSDSLRTGSGRRFGGWGGK